MVTDEVWALLHPEGVKGFLHAECLLERAHAQKRELTAESFTVCLCYVNRHIHLPTPVLQLEYLVRYFGEDTPAARNRPRPHYGYVVAHALQGTADGDLWMARPGAIPSPFAHLFNSDAFALGSQRLP